MSDIVERLRNWRTVHLARLHLLLEEAADEMEKVRIQLLAAYQLGVRHRDPPELRNGSVESRETVRQVSSQENFPTPENAAQQETPCPHVVGKTTQYCSLTPFTLTDAERKAIEEAADFIDAKSCASSATLRSLLERTK
jgi:hypothetical protein